MCVESILRRTPRVNGITAFASVAMASKNYRFVRSYVGPLRAAVLDWSGTTADKYVLAPAVTFVEVFSKHKVPITMQEAREPMGLRKDLHIAAITQMPSVRQRWQEAHGRAPDQGDVDRMFADFVPLQLATLKNYSTLIPGTAEAMNTLRSEFNMKIGCTTGFLKSMADVLLEGAKTQGYVPDASVAGDEVIHGTRPRPFMLYRNMDMMDVHPVQAVVKVDDTASGIGEAMEAGCWGVGVARYSNYMDIDSFEHEASLSEQELASRTERSREILSQSGAHYVIDSVADLPEVVADINKRMAQGERP